MSPVLALAAAAFTSTLVMRMTDPVVPLLAAEFGVAPADLAQLATAYTIPYALFQLVFGPLGDRFGKTAVVRIAVILLAISVAATALAPSFQAMLVLRVLSGAVGGAIIPLGLATIGDRYAMPERQVMLSRFILAVILGQMAGSFLTGILAEHVPWRAIFVGYGVVTLMIAGLLFTVPRVPGPAGGAFTLAGVVSRYGTILARPAARVLLATVFVEGALFFGAIAFMAPFMAEVHGYGASDIGMVAAAYGIGSILFSLALPFILRVAGPYRMMASGGLLAGLAVAVFALSDPLWVLGAMSLVIGFAFYLVHNNLQTRATELAPEARGSALALFAGSLFLGNGTGPAIMHVAVGLVGYHAAFYGLALAIAVFGPVSAIAVRRLERGTAQAVRAPG